MEETVVSTRLCVRCHEAIPADATVCAHCGAHQYDQGEEMDDDEARKWVRVLAFFYGTDLVVCTIVNFMEYFRGLEWLFITEAVLGVLTLLFITFLWKDISPLLQWKSFSIIKALKYCLMAFVFAVLVNVVIKWLNKSIFNQSIYYYQSFRRLPYPKLGMIALVALLPAVFEEMGYRGIILHSLFKLADKRQAILVGAFMFAVIHMSFISFFWLLPFAVWLGNIRWKEKTIWYGVLIHFCFNITACLFEFYELHLFGLHA